MSRGDLERLSKDEMIEMVLRLQRPAKTSRTGTVTGTESGRQSSELGPEAHVAVAISHALVASARNWRRVLRETRWRWVLKVLWTAAWADRKR